MAQAQGKARNKEQKLTSNGRGRRRIFLAPRGSVIPVLLAIILVLLPPAVHRTASAAGGPSALTPEERSILDTIDYDHAWQELEALSRFPEKVGGSPEEAAAQQYVYQKLTGMGMDYVTWETFDTQTWVHDGTTVRIMAPMTEDLPATTYGGSYSIWGREKGRPYYFGNANNGKTLVALVVDAGFGTAAEFGALGDVTGKIVLVHRDDDATLWPNVSLEEAAAHDAAAVLFYGYYGSYPNADAVQQDAVLPDGIKQDAVGGSIPAISISIHSAVRIKELLARGEVTLQIDGRADLIDERNAQSSNVIAYLWGSKRPEEYVVFSAHVDTWWTGTLDDLSGIACVLEYARLFSQARAMGIFDNERTLVFASFGAEEFGGPHETWYNWLIGSYEFVKAHPDLVDKTVIDLNLDMVSLKKASGKYWVEQSPEANDLVADAIADLGMTGPVSYYNPAYSWVDAWSFHAKGGTTSVNVNWVANQDEIYHTQLDTMEYASPEPLKIVLDLYTLLGIRADHALVLPVNLVHTLDWAAGYLASDRAAAPSEAEYFEAAAAALANLRTQVSQANACADSLRSAYAAASAEGKEAILGDADALNDALFTARKMINIWTLGEGGTAGSWDVFLRSHQHAHDIGGIDAAITALQRGRVANALTALQTIYTMEWGHRFSREAYRAIFDWMSHSDRYWGAVWDQQQDFVDVQGIYLGLSEGTMTAGEAKSSLQRVRSEQLVPWLREDLTTLQRAWSEAARILEDNPCD